MIEPMRARTDITLPDGSILTRSDRTEAGEGRLAIVHGGSYFHLQTMRDPAVVAYQPDWRYIADLAPDELARYPVVIVADRLHPDLVREHSTQLRAVAESGRTLVVLGCNEVETWLPGVHHHDRPTNFWWWRTGEDPGIRPRIDDSPPWRYLTPKAVVWHHHGAYTVDHAVRTLVDLEEPGDGDTWVKVGAVLYEDTVSTPGRLIVTSLDPFFHHGSNFMPGASRFLYTLLRWIDGMSQPRTGQIHLPATEGRGVA